MAQVGQATAGADARPLPEYATLTASFWAVFALFVASAGRRLPERISFADLTRNALATYKLSRLVSKEPVAAFVRAPVTEDAEGTEPKRDGVQRVLGELVTCPYCLGVWISSALGYALVLYPRQTRLATTIFAAQAVADFLHAAFVRARGG